MQWFKHDTNATMDFKIKKLIIKYGAVGYAIYFHCLELIADSISDNNINFELEHDSEIIADDLRIQGTQNKSGAEIVEEIMRYMVELKLFEEDNGHIFCFKLLKRLDTSMTSNARLREMISKAKKKANENHDSIMTNHDFIMLEEKRRDKIRQEENFCASHNFSSKVSPRDIFNFYKENKLNISPEIMWNEFNKVKWRNSSGVSFDWKEEYLLQCKYETEEKHNPCLPFVEENYCAMEF